MGVGGCANPKSAKVFCTEHASFALKNSAANSASADDNITVDMIVLLTRTAPINGGGGASGAGDFGPISLLKKNILPVVI